MLILGCRSWPLFFMCIIIFCYSDGTSEISHKIHSILLCIQQGKSLMEEYNTGSGRDLPSIVCISICRTMQCINTGLSPVYLHRSPLESLWGCSHENYGEIHSQTEERRDLPQRTNREQRSIIHNISEHTFV